MIIVPAPSKSLVTELKALFPGKTIVGIDTMADIQILQGLLEVSLEEPIFFAEVIEEMVL